MLWAFLTLRVFVNPLSNVFQKVLARRNVPPLIIVSTTHTILAPVCLPLLLISPPPMAGSFWLNMILCAVLAGAANVLLVKAVQMSDLSILGPVNAYKSIVSIAPGIVLLREVPSMASVVGIILILAGSYIIVDRATIQPGRSVMLSFFRDRAVQVRLAALVLSAVEAVFLKRALAGASPLATFAVWSVLGCILLAPFAYRQARSSGGLQPVRTNLSPYLWLATTTGLMQFSTLVIFTGFQVAPALALFQISTLVSVLLGWRIFQEQDIPRRMVGSLVMVAGAAIIIATEA